MPGGERGMCLLANITALVSLCYRWKIVMAHTCNESTKSLGTTAVYESFKTLRIFKKLGH